MGVTAAAFFVAVFPGNIAQFTGHRDAFGLDTDAERFVRRGEHWETAAGEQLAEAPET